MKNKGFTLIEFIVVLAIVGILSAVLVPNIFSRQQADENELNNQIRIVNKALTLCYALEGRYPPEKYGGNDNYWIDYLINKNYLIFDKDTYIVDDKNVYKHKYDEVTGVFSLEVN